MKAILQAIIIATLLLYTIGESHAQNRDWVASIAIGIGNSGFSIEDHVDDELKSIYYPTAGLQVQKRLNDKWAFNAYPNVGMSGTRRTFSVPVGSITEVRSTSAFVNLALHAKYFINKSFYCSAGPEFSHLIWNYGSTYGGATRYTNYKETDLFASSNLLLSSSIGYSKKVGESRKNAPKQIDVCWFLEFRIKKGVTNILNTEVFNEGVSTSILAFELVTGISFASKS